MIHANQFVNPTTFNVRPVQRTAFPGELFDRQKLTYLVQFVNDMTGDVQYAYPCKTFTPDTEAIRDFGARTSSYQWSEINFKQVQCCLDQTDPNCINPVNMPNVYSGQICLREAGYWYYVICEVYFPKGIVIDFADDPNYTLIRPGLAPIDFENTFEEGKPGDPDPEIYKGQLGIIVEEGKMLVKRDPTQITYESYVDPDDLTNNNYIYNGEQ